MLIGRRDFLALLGATMVVRPALAVPRETFRITSLSGGGGIFVKGTLVALDPDRHAAAIDGIRRATGYWRQLRYSSTDPAKAPFVEALVKHFAAEADLHYVAEMSRGPTAGHTPGRLHGLGPHRGLGELAAFVTGCVYGQAVNATHPLKRDLAATTIATLAKTGRFSVEELAA